MCFQGPRRQAPWLHRLRARYRGQIEQALASRPKQRGIEAKEMTDASRDCENTFLRIKLHVVLAQVGKG